MYFHAGLDFAADGGGMVSIKNNDDDFVDIINIGNPAFRYRMIKGTVDFDKQNFQK